MNNTPFFTIIVAVYNAQSTLQQCIDSFASQRYANKELIVIDGDSSDQSVDIIKKNVSNISYFLSEADTGIYNAWNKALPHIRGNWVYFLGADDYFRNEGVLEKVALKLNQLPRSINVAYGQVDYVSPSGTHLFTRGQPWDEVGKKYTQLMTIPHQGVFHRASMFDCFGSFDESFKIAGDYEFLLRELKCKDAFFIPLIVTVMAQGGISNSNSNSMLIIDEMRRAQKKNGLSKPGVFWVLAKVRVYIRIILWRVLGENTARKILDLGRYLMNEPARWTKNR